MQRKHVCPRPPAAWAALAPQVQPLNPDVLGAAPQQLVMVLARLEGDGRGATGRGGRVQQQARYRGWSGGWQLLVTTG
jgi:hypothetical protein